ncbi:MAG TPA: hypothetical protein ENI42_04295 [Thermoplasmatales archaeon]|nr:hypothetical protein [Thermoplasmatales archaeon]
MKVSYLLFLTMVFLIVVLLSSGCLEQIGEIFTNKSEDGFVQYEAAPTSLSYVIFYGYNVTSAGTGSYTVTYLCPLPVDPLDGEIVNISLFYPHEYSEIVENGNTFVKWVIKGENNGEYTLGVEAEMVVNTFMVDLSGRNTLDVSSIPPNLVDQYCHRQSINSSDAPLIDPVNDEILSIAFSIKNLVQSNNSFDVAKEIFLWLKNNTSYRTHEGKTMVQSAYETLHLKTGDCDDLSFLYISLCRAVGIPARFVKGYLIEEDEAGFHAVPHAWAEVFVGVGKNGWIPVECAGNGEDAVAEMHQNFGVEDAFHLRLFVDDGSNRSMELSLMGPSWEYQPHVDVHLSKFTFLDDVEEFNQRKLTVYSDGRRVYLQ